MLAAIEKRFKDRPVAVIGVHSPKFPNERDPEGVRQAIARYGITHPVVVDSGFEIWSEYGVNAWPTLVLVDPEGKIVGAGSGEPDEQTLSAAIETVLSRADPSTLATEPLRVGHEALPKGALSYPGKVIASNGIVFVADTGHHQIIAASPDGDELYRIGSGVADLSDGDFSACALQHPNGMVVIERQLLIADTGNHSIRVADLEARQVRTIAGIGQMGRGLPSATDLPTKTPLRSPWDLASDGELLYIAMAGSHQIWSFNLALEKIGPFAGTGREVRADGPAHAASFAQPSGLALLGETLYVADSEISSVRSISLDQFPTVSTVCGSGELFGFGDRDGTGASVLLQHPIGIAADDEYLYIADTYNHKVKRVHPSSGLCETLFGDGEPERTSELVPGKPLSRASPHRPCFFEPEGIAVMDGVLLVADTNNHRVISIELETGERSVILGAA